jgi:predicted transcriptional regulator
MKEAQARVPPLPQLSRRERQIMDVIYRLGSATAADTHAALPDPPTYTAVRGLLRVMVDKGYLRHTRDGKRYVYRPSTPRPAAGASSILHVVRTFFAGSPSEAMAALLGSEKGRLSDAELDRLETLVRAARTRKRRGPR